MYHYKRVAVNIYIKIILILTGLSQKMYTIFIVVLIRYYIKNHFDFDRPPAKMKRLRHARIGHNVAKTILCKLIL